MAFLQNAICLPSLGVKSARTCSILTVPSSTRPFCDHLSLWPDLSVARGRGRQPSCSMSLLTSESVVRLLPWEVFYSFRKQTFIDLLLAQRQALMILRNEIDSLGKNIQSNAGNPPYFSPAFTVILQTLLAYFL